MAGVFPENNAAEDCNGLHFFFGGFVFGIDNIPDATDVRDGVLPKVTAEVGVEERRVQSWHEGAESALNAPSIASLRLPWWSLAVVDGLLASLKMVLDLRGEHRALIIGVQ